jgi:hypothetical protein
LSEDQVARRLSGWILEKGKHGKINTDGSVLGQFYQSLNSEPAVNMIKTCKLASFKKGLQSFVAKHSQYLKMDGNGPTQLVAAISAAGGQCTMADLGAKVPKPDGHMRLGLMPPPMPPMPPISS